MKKNILAIAIASAVAAPVAMADAPTVYGQFNVAMDSISIDGAAASNATGMNVVNRNSRVGVKGSEDLGNGLKAVYQLETTVNVPNGGAAGGSFGGARNTFVGLNGGFGTVVAGRHDSPLRMIQPKDGFADSALAGNNTSNFNGGLAGEDRLDEVVAYLGTFGDISVAAALVGQNGLNAAASDASLAHTNSFSVAYGSKSKPIYAAVGMTGETDSGRSAITRATVQYNQAGLLASFMYNAQADVGNSMTFGGAYKMGALTPRAKLSMVSYDAAGADSSMNMAAGVDYSLGKKTRVYAEYATLDENNASTGGAATTGMSVGLFHKF